MSPPSESDTNDIGETQFVDQSGDEDVLWAVQEITAERGKKYRVKWAGIDPATQKPWAQSWVAKHDCTNDLVTEWKAKKKRLAAGKKRGKRTSTTSRTPGTSKRAGSSTSGTKTRSSTLEANSPRLDSVEQYVSPPPKQSTTKRKRQSETPASGAAQADEQSEFSRPHKKQKTMVEVLLPPISSDEDGLVPNVHAKVTLQNKVPPKSNSASLGVSDENDSSPPKAKSKSERRSDARSKLTAVSARASGMREESKLPHSKTKTKIVPRRKERVTDADVLSAGSQDEELRPRKSKKKSTSKRKSPLQQNDDLSEREVESTASPIKIGPPRGVKRQDISRESGRHNKPGPSRTKPREDDSADERAPAEESKNSPDHEVLSFGSPLLLQRDVVDGPALTIPPTHISIPQVPLNARSRSPDLSPGARARLELFDRMVMGLSQDDAPPPPPDAPEHVPDDTYFIYDDTHDIHDSDTFDPPRPLSPPPSKLKPKHSQLGTHNGLIVPETESSGNSQSQSQPLLKPPPPQPPLACDQSLGKPIDLPTIAVITASAASSSASPQDLPQLRKLPLSTNSPSKKPKPTFKISSSTFRSATNARSRAADPEAPPSSIESFTSPGRVDKGKQRAVEDDPLQSGPSEGEGDGEHLKGRRQRKITDSELKKRGKELLDQVQLAREAAREKKKKEKRLKSVNDIVNGTMSSPSKRAPLPFTSGAESALAMSWEDVVDLSGGINSTTSDTPEHSKVKPLSEEERKRLRVELRQEEGEENTQGAMGAHPLPPVNESDVINGVDLSGGANSTTLDTPEHSEVRPLSEEERKRLRIELRQEEEESTQEAMGAYPLPPVNESDVINGGDAQMPPPRSPMKYPFSAQVEDVDHVDQPSADLQQVSVIVQASQGERQEDTDIEPLPANQPTSSPPCPIPVNLTDSPRRRLGEALSLLNVKSEEIQRLERELADERKNLQGSKVELAELQQSSEPTGPVRAAWEAERALWTQERSKWENDFSMWEAQRKEMSEEKANLSARVAELSDAAVRAEEAKAKLSGLEEERVNWTEQRIIMLNEISQRSEELAVATKVRGEYDQARLQWEVERTLWVEEKARWETERAALQERQETLSRSVDELTASVESMRVAKVLAEKDSDFFREQYSQASGFVGSVREENVELEKRVKIAEGQAQEGVAAIKALFEGRVKALQADVDRWKGLTQLLQEKDRRTNDELRLQAAQVPELGELCGRLKTQNKSLEADVQKLGRAQQRSVLQRNRLFYEILLLKKERASLRFKLSKLVKMATSSTQETSQPVPSPPILDDPESMDPNDMEILPDPTPQSSDATFDELFPCMWRPQWRDQCQQIFDTKEDLERHVQEHLIDLSAR